MSEPDTLRAAVLLTITTTHRPATDLGHLLRKHPGKTHLFEQSFGRAHVFYPEATEERCVKWETLRAGQFRHKDHRFEWTRAEFQAWANRVAGKYGYTARFVSVGPDDPNVGSPTQMAVFGTLDR